MSFVSEEDSAWLQLAIRQLLLSYTHLPINGNSAPMLEEVAKSYFQGLTSTGRQFKEVLVERSEFSLKPNPATSHQPSELKIQIPSRERVPLQTIQEEDPFEIMDNGEHEMKKLNTFEDSANVSSSSTYDSEEPGDMGPETTITNVLNHEPENRNLHSFQNEEIGSDKSTSTVETDIMEFQNPDPVLCIPSYIRDMQSSWLLEREAYRLSVSSIAPSATNIDSISERNSQVDLDSRATAGPNLIPDERSGLDTTSIQYRNLNELPPQRIEFYLHKPLPPLPISPTSESSNVRLVGESSNPLLSPATRLLRLISPATQSWKLYQSTFMQAKMPIDSSTSLTKSFIEGNMDSKSPFPPSHGKGTQVSQSANKDSSHQNLNQANYLYRDQTSSSVPRMGTRFHQHSEFSRALHSRRASFTGIHHRDITNAGFDETALSKSHQRSLSLPNKYSNLSDQSRPRQIITPNRVLSQTDTIDALGISNPSLNNESKTTTGSPLISRANAATLWPFWLSKGLGKVSTSQTSIMGQNPPPLEPLGTSDPKNEAVSPQSSQIFKSLQHNTKKLRRSRSVLDHQNRYVPEVARPDKKHMRSISCGNLDEHTSHDHPESRTSLSTSLAKPVARHRNPASYSPFPKAPTPQEGALETLRILDRAARDNPELRVMADKFWENNVCKVLTNDEAIEAARIDRRLMLDASPVNRGVEEKHTGSAEKIKQLIGTPSSAAKEPVEQVERRKILVQQALEDDDEENTAKKRVKSVSLQS